MKKNKNSRSGGKTIAAVWLSAEFFIQRLETLNSELRQWL